MQDCGHTPEWTGGPSVERVMRNGKRIFSTAFKLWLVEQAGDRDVSVAGLALRHGVNANQLRHWMRLAHLRTNPGVPMVLPVTVAQAAPQAVQPRPLAVIEIEVAGAVVRVRDGVDEHQLRVVLRALRS